MDFSDFKIARRWGFLNRLLQIVLAILLAVSLNYLVSRSGAHRRYGLALSQARVLSLETRRQLEHMARSAPASESATPWITIYLTLSQQSAADSGVEERLVPELLRQTQNLLGDLQFAAAQGGRENWLKVEQTDTLRQAGVFAGLQRRHPGIDQRSAIVILCRERGKERCRVLSIRDLLVADASGAGRDPMFNGEEALASALHGITGERPPVFYFVGGHGGMSPDDNGPDGLASLETKLRVRNIDTRQLDLSRVNEVPADADLLLIAAPRTPLAATEVEKLRRHLRDRHGRAIVLVNPGDRLGPLDDLLYEYSITVPDALIHDASTTAKDAPGNLLTHIYPVPHELARVTGRQHLAFAKARPVRKNLFREEEATLVVTELAGTDANPPGEVLTWGETNYANRPFSFDPVRDLEAPLPVAVVAERSFGLRMNLPSSGSRLLVLGSGDIASNARIGLYGNDFFLLNAINWMLDRNQYLGIPPRRISGFRLAATNADLSRVAYWFALLPLGALLLGFLVFLWRRNT
ncbi:MAG: Gldg family protein [Puniceicoccales bacterium]|jgi:hypothetical protein|nr:Gldg family protein [Puniceicoccales bacterium]